MKKMTALAAALTSCAALAQPQEDAVVITATRAPQPSLQVPASVDRIEADEIRAGRPQVNLSESLGRVPGIVVQNRQNYAQDLQISSRGFGARSTFGVRGIRLIADGIPATMPDGQGQAATFSLSSAQRIEVLRGPFSALYGNASGGVISVETRDGPQTPTGEASLHAGSYDTWRAGLVFGGQWGALNAIGDVSRFDTNGYREHSAATRDHLNAKLRYRLSDDTSFTLVANSLRQPDTQDPLGLTRSDLEADSRQAVAGAFLFNTRKTVNQDQVGTTLSHRLGPGRVEAMLYGGERFVEQFLAFRGATPLLSAGGVVNLDRGYGGGALRYSRDFSTVRLSVGVEHERMRERRRGFVNEFGVAGALRRDEDNGVRSTDVYAQAEWRLAERWSLHGGVRHSRVRFESEDDFVTADNPDDSGERNFSATTPVVGLLYRASPRLSLYANLGRGFETPTFVELAYRSGGTGLNFELDASRSRHAEVGFKAIVASALRLNAALFDIVTEDEIVVDVNNLGRAIFKNAGHTDRRGFELGAETVLGGPWDVRVAWTYLEATFRESFAAGANIVPAGSRLPGVPRAQLYGELRYRRPGYFAQLEGLARSRVAVNDQNSEFAEAFSVFNAVAGLVQQGGRWRVTEFVRIDNLADRDYAGSVIVNDGNGRYYEPSPRRNMTVGIQASLQF
ncbi:MAG TPA: TonB-dependent receptor [Burkholderiales bacterium]|nr:TonB-dependent receptor [Burkholderiales bacterium]